MRFYRSCINNKSPVGAFIMNMVKFIFLATNIDRKQDSIRTRESGIQYGHRIIEKPVIGGAVWHYVTDHNIAPVNHLCQKC